MDLYARVNILRGQAVRLPKGDLSNVMTLDEDVINWTRLWISKGAHRLLVVDLDAAAYGDYCNRPLIDEMLASFDMPIQVAGGIRSPQEAERLLEAGAWRIVMGTAAIEDQIMVWDLCRQFPNEIVVSLDVRPDEELAVRGWTENSGRFLEDVLIEMSSAGAAAFMLTEAGRDSLAEPPNLEALCRAMSIVDEGVIAAGGVRDLRDVAALRDLRADGKQLDGIVVGRAVNEGRITLEDAAQVLAGEREP